MTNARILETAMQQSALESNCKPSDFLRSDSIVTESRAVDGARVYLDLPYSCDLISYGNNVVASVAPELVEPVSRYVKSYLAEHCFETPNLLVLQQELRKHAMDVCFMAEYFLPDVNLLRAIDAPFEFRVLGPRDFAGLYLDQWGNALCEKRKEYDVLAVGAYDGGRLIALAGCSADCENMWQIGIDVLPQYRRMGLASALTSRLALETIDREKVPFYCAAWSNIKSVRNAIKSGFRPSWVQVTAKSFDAIQSYNLPS